MDLINHTNYPAMLFKAGLPEEKLAVSAIVKITFDVKSGTATASRNMDWPVSDGAWESEYGPIEGDAVFKKEGVDIMAFGNAIPENNIPTRQMIVKINVQNKLSYELQVFGDRKWKKDVFGMGVTVPETFTKLPLTLNNAYGGFAEWDELKVPFGNNPYGKGYYLEKEHAVNNPLPNIENPKKLIRNWNDMPDPVGVTSCPFNELRMRNNIEFDNEGAVKKFEAALYNSAFPGMVVKEMKPGEMIEILGMTSAGKWTFVVPDLVIKTKIVLGEKLIERNLVIDQIGLVPEKDQAFITYRYPFTYSFVPLQTRTCEILSN